MININRNNYESFLLLYVDGELNATERIAFEGFLSENIDVQSELMALQQTVLKPDVSLQFSNKNTLYKVADSFVINLSNYEDFFLRYVDNELTIQEKSDVEMFVLKNPSLQEAFTMLKQTILPAEVIYYPKKETLYRTEKGKKPIFYIQWQRMAAAAIFAGLGIMTWILLQETGATKQYIPEDIASNNNQITPIIATPSQKEIPINQLVELSSTAIPDKKAVSDLSTDSQQNTASFVIKKEKFEPESTIASYTNSLSNTYTLDQLVSADVQLSPKDISPISQANETESEKTETYKMLDIETEDEKKSLRIASLEINKDKLRGLFRKASSLFRNKAKSEDNLKDITASNSPSLK